MVKNNLTVSDIIAFVHKAMENNMDVSVQQLYGDASKIYIIRKDCVYINITFDISTLTIEGGNGEFLEKEYSYTDREVLEINFLELEIKEYQEGRATKLFNNFFTPNNTPTSIDDLNDNDD
jgi:hypothetical protein